MKGEYQVQVSAGKQSREFQVVVEPLPEGEGDKGAGRFRVSLDGKEQVVQARRFDERGNVVSWSMIDADGRQVLSDLDGAGPDYRVSVSGREPMQVKVKDSRDVLLTDAGRGGGSGGESGEVRAAMPGKVVKVLCQVGETVKAGQGLLIIEAMKMENELRAPVGGTVKTLSIREGLAVEAGQTLLTLEPQK